MDNNHDTTNNGPPLPSALPNFGDPVQSLADAISEPITKAYRVGGFGLAFLLLGALMMLTATLKGSTGIASYLLASAGLVLIVIPCYFFYVKEIRPISTVRQSVVENKEVIDLVQATALSMTDLTGDLQALAFKYANEVNQALGVVRSQIRPIPGIGQLADHPMLSTTHALSDGIVTTTLKIKEIVTDIREALVTSDPDLLRKYLAEVDTLKINVTRLLASSLPATQ